MTENRIDAEVAVIGSGAGGALTAAVLAEAGCDVVVLEDGDWVDPHAHAPFSRGEMQAKYRNRGVTAMLGRPAVAYVEARCAGGGPEINSGLYHRPPGALVEEWVRRDEIADCSADVLHRYSERIERDLSVSALPGPPSGTSAALERGAGKLGWDVVEVPRWFSYASGPRGEKQTMTRTYLPRAIGAGARLVTGCRAERLLRRGPRVTGVACRLGEGRVVVHAEHVFLAGGAIQSAALLQRSGLGRNVGRLKCHPTVKLAARFPTPLDGHDDVPVHQVKEFAPDLTFGGSASRRGYVALALADDWKRRRAAMDDWESVAVYYAAIRSDGGGRVRAIPGVADPLVAYRLRDSDLSRMARGLVQLGELLFAAGAVELYPSVRGAPSITTPRDLGRLWDLVTAGDTSVMTIHLFSTVRMGERRAETAADSFGRVWGVDNLRVNDASLLPDAPGVNPQGSVMALAARNCDHFLGER